MSDRTYAIILAGGDGERLWPVSTPARPKQFVELFGDKALIRHAVDNLGGLVPPERVLVITAERLVAMTRKALPMVPPGNIIGEPCRRDTAAAVAVACGLVRKLGGPDAIGCILTADHLIEPAKTFRRTLGDAARAADRCDAIVTIGVVPVSPATRFGYIENGEEEKLGLRTVFHRARRFVEKPDLPTARKFLATGRYRWNAGMFIWKERVMEVAFTAFAPDIGMLIGEIAAARSVRSAMKRLYPSARSTSVDYAVMEHAPNILVAQSDFCWDDVGSWLALPNHFPADADGNMRLGKTALQDVTGSVVVSEDDHVTAVLGLKDVVVVRTAEATLVCAKDRVGDIRKLVRELQERE